MTRKIGIYSGTFDPVHVGHIAFATEAACEAQLERVVFIPERSPRGKSNVAPLSARIAQLEDALRNTPHAVYQATASTFTIKNTLSELEVLYPQVELHFLIGSDIVPSLAEWSDIDELLAKHRLVVGMRSNHDQVEITSLLDRLGARYQIVTTDYPHVSSRHLRG